MYVNERVESSIGNLPLGQHKIVCPDCQNLRKNKKDRTSSGKIKRTFERCSQTNKPIQRGGF